MAGMLAAYFAVQLAFSFLMQVSASPTWDFGIVFSAAKEYVLNGTMPGEYFTQFHNNAPMYLLLVAFFKLLHAFGAENFMPFALVLNNLLINASLLALYWALRQLYGAKNALFGLAGAFLFLCFLMYGPILYTDTATMPFSHSGACRMASRAPAAVGEKVPHCAVPPWACWRLWAHG